MSMPRAAVSFLTSCSDSSKGWRGQWPTLNWRPEARAKGYGSMSRLACAACGAEDQIATVVLPAGTRAPVGGQQSGSRASGHIERVRKQPRELGEHASQWAAIHSIAEKIGCSGETLRRWVRQART
jgi:hypothetical protein